MSPIEEPNDFFFRPDYTPCVKDTPSPGRARQVRLSRARPSARVTSPVLFRDDVLLKTRDVSEFLSFQRSATNQYPVDVLF